MVRNFIRLLLLLPMIAVISGCVPYYKLSKREFPQGIDLPIRNEISRDYVKAQTVYDQFTTLAHFDAMWLSDQTRIAYVDTYCQKRGKTGDAKEAFLRRQLEENRHWISFYVLADVRDVFNGTMSDKTPVWTPYLEIGEIKIEPVTIKEVDLEPEYISLFGSKLNSFKTVYLVSFPANDATGKFYLDGSKNLKLVFSSVDKACSMEWDLEQLNKHPNSHDNTSDGNKDKHARKHKKSDKNKNVGKDIDFYWGA